MRCAVIPALDEQATIAAVVGGAAAVTDRVIVVDNGSADGTAAEAEAAGAALVSERERGYGAACLAGALAAPAGALLLYLDADGAEDPADLERIAAPVEEGRADLVLGSRALGQPEPGALAPHQRAANRAVSAIIRRLWRAPVTDVGPLRAVRREQLLALEMRSRTYGWPVEMLVKAARAGLRIEEIPVNARPRAAGASKVSGSLRASLHAGLWWGWTLIRYGLGPRA